MMDKRKIEENIFKALMLIAAGTILISLVIILGTVVIKGFSAMNWAMITQTPKGGYYLGKEGGVLNAILGSLYLAGGATLLSSVISLPVVLYMNVYAKKRSLLVVFTRFSLDVLWGVPSIVFGAFGFTIMLFFGLRASLLAGMITVALLILPIMSRAMDEVIKMVPEALLEASYSLGATRLETAFKVVVRQALPGIVTAVLMALGRGMGDAASVIFTAGFTDDIPNSLFRPVATLPLAIFFQLGTPFPEVRDRAYASALILTIVILTICIVSRVISKRYTQHIIK
jgi:phosphate transport system permease protein